MRPAKGSYSSASSPTALQRERRTIKQLAGLQMAALQNVIVDRPKAARQKSALSRRQAVAGICAFIPQNEFVLDQQPLLNGPNRISHARIGCRQKAHERDQQKASVESFRAVGLHETFEIAVKTAFAHFGMDLSATARQCRPASIDPSAANSFAARSNATQAMTFEWTKCCCSPRISQMPRSGSRQALARYSNIMGRRARPRSVKPIPPFPAWNMASATSPRTSS
jgi:hypothetical protein